jgi:hypothetical protein
VIKSLTWPELASAAAALVGRSDRGPDELGYPSGGRLIFTVVSIAAPLTLLRFCLLVGRGPANRGQVSYSACAAG